MNDSSTKKEIEDYIRALSDIQLVAYLDKETEEQTIEGIACARKEASQRNLSSARLQALREELVQQRQREDGKTEQPLENLSRLCFFLMGVFPFYGIVALLRSTLPGIVVLGAALFAEMIPWIVIVAKALRYRDEGFRRKSKEAWTFGLTGIAAHVILLQFGCPPWSFLYRLLYPQ